MIFVEMVYLLINLFSTQWYIFWGWQRTRYTPTAVILHNVGTNHTMATTSPDVNQPWPHWQSRVPGSSYHPVTPAALVHPVCCSFSVWRTRCKQARQLPKGLSVGRGWFLQVRTRECGEYADMLSCLHWTVAGGLEVLLFVVEEGLKSKLNGCHLKPAWRCQYWSTPKSSERG